MNLLTKLIIFLHIQELFASSKLSFVVSQQGINEASDFTVKQGLNFLQKNPLSVYLKNAEKPSRTLADVELKNGFLLKNFTIDLHDDLVGVTVNNFTFRSDVTIVPQIWPFSSSHESVQYNMTLIEGYFAISTENSTRLWLKNCNITKHKSHSVAKNYWFVDVGLKVATSYTNSYINELLCPQIGGVLDIINSFLSASIPLSHLIDEAALPLDLRKVNLMYDVSGLRVKKGRLAAGISIKWQKPAENDQKIAASEGGPYHLDVDISQSNGHHVTLWIHEGIVNDFLSLFNWTFQWLETEIPVTDEKIPKSSRDFFSTLCDFCHFELKVNNLEQPSIIAGNNTLDLGVIAGVHLRVVNPSTNKSAMFVSFVLYFDGQVLPYIVNGTVKAKMDLVKANISIEGGAFPEDWGGFIAELVEGMITTVMWPAIKEGLENITDTNGVPLSPSCGLKPESADITILDGKFGISADLRLSNFNGKQCAEDIDKALPKGNSTMLGMS